MTNLGLTRPSPAPPPPLPRLLVLTDRRAIPGGRSLLETLEAVVRTGARAVVVRERDLPREERAGLVAACAALLGTVAGLCLVAAPDPSGPGCSRAGGLHLRASSPLPRRRPTVLGRSAHRAEEVAQAAADGLDYVTISPVGASASKPGYGPILGPEGLRSLLDTARRQSHVPLPKVFALGGVEAPLCPDLLAAGAYGVAVLGAVMRAHNPAAVTAGLLSALTPGAGPVPEPPPGLVPPG